MPAFTTNQWAILFLVLVLGWVLGLASRTGGKKWRRAYEAEREERAEIERRHAEELAAAQTRIAELERARVAPTPVVAPVVTPTPTPPVTPLAGAAATTAAARARGDDLSLIRGIGPVGEERLNEQGIYSFRDIRTLDAAGKAALETRVGAPTGTIDRDRWQEQAELLEAGQIDEHRRRFG